MIPAMQHSKEYYESLIRVIDCLASGQKALDAIAVIDKADKDRKLNNLGIIIAICCGVGGLILSIISLIRADQSDSRMDELENRVTILESRATILERSGPPQK